MMQCSDCSNEYDDSFLYCPHCGAKKQPDQLKKCPYCAEWVKAKAIKCRYCGELLEEISSEDATNPASQIETAAESYEEKEKNEDQAETTEESITNEQPAWAVEYAIPLIKRQASFSIGVEYWGLAFSGDYLYVFMMSRNSAPTVTGFLYGGLIDGILGIKNKRAVNAAQKRGLEEVLSMTKEWHCLTPAEIAKTKIRKGPFRFRVMFPELNGRKEFSLVIWNKYRAGFLQYFDKLESA
jgi:hypothetical protein